MEEDLATVPDDIVDRQLRLVVEDLTVRRFFSESVEDGRQDDKFNDDIFLVSSEGASSSSLSLQPRPVVKPIPPLNSLPSLCRTLRRGVSRLSFRIEDLDVSTLTMLARGSIMTPSSLTNSESTELMDWAPGKSVELGESRPCFTMRWGSGVCRSKLESESVLSPSNSRSNSP